MNSFIYILSIILLSISVLPCTDGMDSHAHDLTVIEHQDCDHNTEKNEKDCSPLCVCDCCNTNLIIQQDVNFFRKQIAEIFTPSKEVYSDLYVQAFASKIFQPPKFS